MTGIELKEGELWLTPYARAKYKVEKIPDLLKAYEPLLQFKKNALCFEYRLPKAARKNGVPTAQEGEIALNYAQALVDDFTMLL